VRRDARHGLMLLPAAQALSASASLVQMDKTQWRCGVDRIVPRMRTCRIMRDIDGGPHLPGPPNYLPIRISGRIFVGVAQLSL
jgi:hypothetical protein